MSSRKGREGRNGRANRRAEAIPRDFGDYSLLEVFHITLTIHQRVSS
jgi:hypothetical protein